MAAQAFSRRILNAGFLAALVLAGAAFTFAGWYLKEFASSAHAAVSQVLSVAQSGAPVSNTSIELIQNSLGVHSYVARVLLVSCGMFISLSFAFLGFALFLVGASGNSDLAAEGGGTKVSLTALAPGTVAIVAAAILAGVCVTRPLPAEFNLGGRPADRAPARDANDPLRSPDPVLPPKNAKAP